MKILDTLELKSSKVKLGSNVLELPKKDGVIATLGDLSNSEQDVVFGDLEAEKISASCGVFSGIVSVNELCIKGKSAATKEYVDTCISTLEGEVQDAVDELSAKVSSVYKYVGSVETEEALKALDTTNLNNGDVYNVTATDENWALIKTETETKWDKLGSTIDLAPYALKTDVSGCIAAVEAKIPTDYFPATKTTNGDYDASSSGLCLFSLTVVCRANLPEMTKINGKEVATIDKIPTDYLPVIKDCSGIANFVKSSNIVFGCFDATNNESNSVLFESSATVDFKNVPTFHEGLFSCVFVSTRAVDVTDQITLTNNYGEDPDRSEASLKVYQDQFYIDAHCTEIGVKSGISTNKPIRYFGDDIVINDSGCGDYDEGSGDTPIFVTDKAVVKYVNEKIEEDIRGNYLPVIESNKTDDFNHYKIVGCIEIARGELGCESGLHVYSCSYFCNKASFSCGVYVDEFLRIEGKDVATEEYVDNTVNSALLDSKDYVDDKISLIGTAFNFKGNSTYENLPSNSQVGDVYNLSQDYSYRENCTIVTVYKKGDNLAWTEEGWVKLENSVALSEYYDKSEVDDKLEGYLPVEIDANRGGNYIYNSNTKHLSFFAGSTEVMRLCGTGNMCFPVLPMSDVTPTQDGQLTPKKYVDAQVKTATDAVSTLCSAVDTKLGSKADKSTTYTKTEVDNKLDDKLTIRTSDGWDMVDSCVMFLYGVQFYTPSCPEIIFCNGGAFLPTKDTHIVVKKYVDDSISTLESTVAADYATKVELQSTVDNGVLTEDIALTGGTLSGDQFSWEIAPSTGISKLLAVVTMDSDGNIVTPTYKWDKTNKKVKVTVYSTTAVSDNTYTTTITYKK